MFIATLETLDLPKTTEDFAIRMYKEFYPLVKYIVQKVIDHSDDVEDVIQETFVSLLDKLELLESLELYKLNSYIAITAKRKTYIWNSKRTKKICSEISYLNSSQEGLLDAFSPPSKSIEEIIECKDQFDHIMDLMNKLPTHYKEILLLKHRYELSDVEIAQQFNINPNSVRMYVKRAREKFIILVEGEGLYEFKYTKNKSTERAV